MPRNESPENTIMRDVPPGEETGIYYIISGLPFATIWQLLKDWLRLAGCDVDHIEVFQRSTSGWIRLLGQDNFERALHHFQTVPYNDRLLLYIDKNRTESVKVMELIDDPPPKPKLGQCPRAARSKTVSRAQLNATPRDQGRGCPQAATRSDRPNGLATLSAASEAPSAACYLGASSRAHDAPRGGCAVQMGPFFKGGESLQYGSMHDLDAASPRGEVEALHRRQFHLDSVGSMHSELPSRTGSAASLTDLGRQHSDGECCKVQIMSLRPWASPRDVEEWVRHIMGEWASAVSSIDVPTGHQKGCIRGSGYVTFRSSVTARRAVELLNQKPFLGCAVCARLAGEGERSMDREDQVSPAGGPVNYHQDAAASAPCDARAEALAEHAPPVIAHGTFYTPK